MTTSIYIAARIRVNTDVECACTVGLWIVVLMVVCDSTVLKNKHLFLSELVWLIFNLEEKNKWLDEYIHYFILVLSCLICIANVDILELLACCWCWCKLVHLICISSLDWLYHPLLYTGLYRRLHTLLAVTVWLGCPKFGSLTWSPKVHTCTRCIIINNPHEYDVSAIEIHISSIT
jgi:hypothetical protein